ncbi:MAG: hypothetical protein QGF53_11470, partial [Alphaproteobacteria bacterium]|nr:hypothetical protein [Alphaproteobacteria bacterium]
MLPDGLTVQVPPWRTGGALVCLCTVLLTPPTAAAEWEFAGHAAAEARVFPNSPGDAAQGSQAISMAVALQPE